jgi:predicted Zn-dependent protease with MMP-like domain
MTRREFERIVEEARGALPERFRSRLDRLRVRVSEAGPPEPGRFGVFEEGTGKAGRPGDRITLYRRALEAAAEGRAGLVQRIQETLLHELGHARPQG